MAGAQDRRYRARATLAEPGRPPHPGGPYASTVTPYGGPAPERRTSDTSEERRSARALPVGRRLTQGSQCGHGSVAAVSDPALRATVRSAMVDRSYLLLHAGFFTCGFHIAFLVTHLPTDVDLCGLPPSVASWSLALIGLANIVGSLWVGHLVAVSYTHLRAHETVLDLVCRLLLEKKKYIKMTST